MSLRTAILLTSTFICIAAGWILWPSDQVLVSRLDLNSAPLPLDADSFMVFHSDADLERAKVTLPEIVKLNADFKEHDLVRVCWNAPLTFVRSSRSENYRVPYYPEIRACSTLAGHRIQFYVTHPPASLLGTEMSSTFTWHWNVAWYAVPKGASVQMASSGLVWSQMYISCAFVLLILLFAIGRRKVAYA